VQPGEPMNPPWPEGPVFSGSTGKDIDIPLFLADPTHSSPKWFQPFLFGMYRWRTQVITETGWLKTFNVLRAPPPEWLVPADSPEARPQHPLNMPVTDTLTLLGYDAEPTVLMGRPWRLVRYWRATSPDLPHIATVLKDGHGQYRAVEYHPPLNGQLEAYLQARGISPSALPGYVIREELRLVLPSYVEPGQYQVSISPISNRLASQLYDPATPTELLPNEQPLTTLDLQPAPPLNPITLPAPH
jgi:hypothetical protein